MKKIKKHIKKPLNHFRIQQVENLVGIVAKNVRAGEQAPILTREVVPIDWTVLGLI